MNSVHELWPTDQQRELQNSFWRKYSTAQQAIKLNTSYKNTDVNNWALIRVNWLFFKKECSGHEVKLQWCTDPFLVNVNVLINSHCNSDTDKVEEKMPYFDMELQHILAPYTTLLAKTLRTCIDVFRFHCATHVWIERNNLLMNCKESFIPTATTVLQNKANSVPQHWTDIAASICLSHVVYHWSWSLTVHEEKSKIPTRLVWQVSFLQTTRVHLYHGTHLKVFLNLYS